MTESGCVWWPVVLRGPELEMRRLEVRMGMGEVTDWTGWSGGDGSGKAWRGEMHGQHSYL